VVGALVALVLTGVVAAVFVQRSGERLFEHAFTSPPPAVAAPGAGGVATSHG
jgi:hypothetical protein